MINDNGSNVDQKNVWLPWHEEGWYERVEAWIDTHLVRNGRIRTGDIEMLHQRLLKLRPIFAAQCRELADFNIPETLTHEEVTEVNVILGQS